MKRLVLLFVLASLTAANADPLITSWSTDISTKYARIYTSAANRTNGVSATTWTGTQSQTSPAYAGVNEINSSATWVYVRSTGLGGHVMGPWNNPNLPKNQSILWRFARTPTVPGSNRITTALTGVGSIGFMVDGVAYYNTSDGFAYSNANSTDASPTAGIGAGDGIWNRDAFPNESVSFDFALAHNQQAGEYHYHINPISTRYLVGDNITYNSTTKSYAENTATVNFQHSPIIGWMKDGLPLYGPYGYDGGSTGASATATLSGTTVNAVNVTAGGTLYQSVPLVTFSGGGSGAAATAVLTGGVVTAVNVTSGGTGYTSAPTVTIGGVRRIISGYQFRDGTNGTTNLTSTGRTTLPGWALTAQNRAQLTLASQYGPAVNATYPIGHYAEDYDYLGDLGYAQSSRTNSGGVFFDLNEYNTRFCVTPEYPNGTWAYFTTITSDGTSFYPYGVGRWFRGTPNGGSTTAAVMNADTPLTQQFLGGANTPIAINTPAVSSPTVSLTWTSVEGGTYSVDASTVSNFSTFTNEKTGLTPNVPTAPTVGNSKATTSTSYPTLGASGTEYARVNRTALATYDSAGQTASTVAQSTIASYTASGTGSPTITNITTAPAVPTNSDTVTVTASIAPPAGRTITTAQLTYDAGSGTTVVFNETMGTAAVTQWAGAGTVYPWTITFSGPPTSPFRQTAAGNNTAVGQGNQFGMEVFGNAPQIATNTITTTNNINATGTSGTVEFYVSTTGITGAQGWDFQTSTDGTNFTTRIDEATAANYAFTLKSYTLSAAERVSTLKLRFRFAGGGMNMAPTVRLDDIKVTIGGASSPVTVNLFDDGAHGDGAAGDGVYGTGSQAGQFIPAQATGTTVSYSIAATDSASATTTSATNSYTVAAANPVLTVTPAGGLTSSGNAGGAFSPASATYTLSNTGTGSMNWTAAKTAAWLTLSSTSGTLAAGTSTTVTASFNAAANSLAAGGYSDTVTFTNSTNGSGNTTRAVSLTVNFNTVPATPVLVALPAFTQGTSKTVSWAAAAGATSYTLEVSTASNFSTVLASQSVTSPAASFSNLTSGVTYYYRVKATNNIGSSIYSNIVSSLQDGIAPLVAITSPASAQTTATATFTVTGTSSDEVNGSGISNVTVNGVTATTANGFATWTISVPLGYGTNGITAVAYDNAGNVTTTAPVNVTLTTVPTYNPLIIPEVITGTTFNLNLHQTSKRFGNSAFQTTANTTTYSYNNMLMWGPTLIMNKGDWVQMNVTNSLPTDTTTTHWHGFHIPAIMDGGPHQTIPAGTTWMPSFYVANNAGTYWYHPHLHQFTQEQVTHGGGGMIIIRDPIESALNLPRTYGVDDFPLALTSRRFQANQFVTTGIAYGDYAFVNGTMSPQVTLPKQYVRLRILNAEVERSYNLGFSDGRTFYQIATDGGLVNAPVALTRIVLAVGERAEILVDLSGDTVGTSFDLQAFNSGQAADFPGGEANTTGPVGSLLNNTTFNVLHINFGATTANPVTTRPVTLTTNTFYAAGDVTNTRALTITGGGGGGAFGFDNLVYSPTVFNQSLNLNAVEQWNLTNNSAFSHAFHIHDVQFHIISRTGGNNAGVKTFEEGWKDVVFISRNQTVSFIAKFDQFASNTNPFMYHCHFLDHEDGGLMGQFLVVNNAVEDLAVASFTRTGDNSLITLQFKATPGTTYTLQYSSDLTTGSWADVGSVTSDGTSASFTETDATRLGQAKGYYRVKIPTIP